MASDEIVWQIINHSFCSYKLRPPSQSAKTPSQPHTLNTFCRNADNLTGLCNRQSCPLANSRYATIRPSPTTGLLYLCTKTVERAHTPAKLWSRVKLSKNYAQALAQIDKELQFWPKYLVHKCKQRLTRLTQVAIRTRRLEKEEERLGEKVVGVLGPKVRRREETRERKAEAAARVERAVERELLERLRGGAYGRGDGVLNVEEGVWRRVLRGLEGEGGVRDKDLDEGEGVEEGEEEWEGEGGVEYVSGDEEEASVGDLEDGVGELEEWFDGESGSGEESDGEEGSSDEEDGEEGSGEEDFTTKREKAPDVGAKRKRGGDNKGARKTKPKMEIEYEVEAPEREAVLA